MYYQVKNKPLDVPFVNKVNKELQIPLLVAAFLSARKIASVDDMVNYLEPTQDLFNPFLMKDMTKAVKRVEKALANKEKIYVCGDYDVDGITSTAILLRFFKKLGYPINYRLPTQTEGHGLSAEAVEKIKELGGNLIITVDNGSTSYDAVDFANFNKIDVIITDHHDISVQGLPKALAIINPKQVDCKSDFKFLSGGGLALYLARAIAKKLGKDDLLTSDLFVLASISTVADVAPLTGDNRKIVKVGLEKMFSSGIDGLKILLEKESSASQFSARDISFKVAPKINAAGKFGFADDAIKLLTETNYLSLTATVKKLLSINESRRELVSSISPDLVKQAKECVLKGDRIIIVHSNHNSAVNGLVAARLAEQFQKPAIVVSFRDGDEGRASCRSVDGFNVQEAIEDLNEYHLGGGGHYMAAGLSIRNDQLENFRKAINEYATQKSVKREDKFWTIDGEVPASFLTKKMWECIQMMEPFGAKNESPLLKIRGVKIEKEMAPRRVFYSAKLGEMTVKVYKNLESTMGEIPLNQELNIVAELTAEEGNPLLIIKDYEIGEVT